MEAKSYESAFPFVGREGELARLHLGLDGVAYGTGSIVLLGGEQGIGKTRLAEQLTIDARGRGMHVLWGRCYERDGAPSFWPWVQILRTYVREHDAVCLREQMGTGAADIAQIVPEVRECLPEIALPPPLEPTQTRFRFFDSVATFLASAARAQPLVLVLDDLHWADGLSLLLLQFLVHELHSIPLLVIGTYRDTEIDRHHPLTAALAELARSEGTERILLAGLSFADVARFIELTDEGPASTDLVDMVARETEGNPFFVTQLVRQLSSEGRLRLSETPASWHLSVPQSVRDVLSRQLERLSPACQDMLAVAALLGREFRLSALQRAGELAGDPLLDAIDEAVCARVIRPVRGAAGRYSFIHTLMRQTLYEELGAAARVRLHRQVGLALESLYGSDVEPYLAELAHHFVQAAPAGDTEKAVAYARRAGERALSCLAFEDAAAHYERALETLRLKEPPDRTAVFELLLAMSDAWSRGGETRRAQAAGFEAAALARELGAPELLARAALSFGTGQARAGQVNADRVALLEEALSLLAPNRKVLRARLLGRLAEELVGARSHRRGDELSRQAVELARALGDPEALAHALAARLWSICWADTLDERMAIAAELIPLAEKLEDQELLLKALHCSIANSMEAGDISAVKKEFGRYARLAEELGRPLYLWYVALRRAMLANLEGRFDDALDLVPRAAAHGQRLQETDEGPICVELQAPAMEARGRLDEFVDQYQSSNTPPNTFPAARMTLILIFCKLNRIKDARVEFEQMAANDFSDLPYDAGRLSTGGKLAEICYLLDDKRRAAALYDLLRPYATRSLVDCGRAFSYSGAAWRPLGLLATTLGRWETAASHFQAAIHHDELMGARPWVACVQEDYGRMLLSRHDPAGVGRAAELLRRALATYRDLRMLSAVERIEAMLGAIEPLPLPRRQSSQDGLTARELEVLLLLAVGSSNREIAEQLVLSPRTAERHVAGIYQKLGARRRADAIAYALHHGLVAQAALSPT